MGYIEEIQQAKEYLKSHGYYTDILWNINDVQSMFNCTEDEAQDVLDGALNNEATMEQIWFAITMHAENDELEKIEEEN
jgi:hypothetical protein